MRQIERANLIAKGEIVLERFDGYGWKHGVTVSLDEKPIRMPFTYVQSSSGLARYDSLLPHESVDGGVSMKECTHWNGPGGSLARETDVEFFSFRSTRIAPNPFQLMWMGFQDLPLCLLSFDHEIQTGSVLDSFRACENWDCAVQTEGDLLIHTFVSDWGGSVDFWEGLFSKETYIFDASLEGALRERRVEYVTDQADGPSSVDANFRSIYDDYREFQNVLVPFRAKHQIRLSELLFQQGERLYPPFQEKKFLSIDISIHSLSNVAETIEMGFETGKGVWIQNIDTNESTVYWGSMEELIQTGDGLQFPGWSTK